MAVVQLIVCLLFAVQKKKVKEGMEGEKKKKKRITLGPDGEKILKRRKVINPDKKWELLVMPSLMLKLKTYLGFFQGLPE